jgi:DICT domain-containing protein
MLLELTRAIEDELCARAGAGVLIGCFQDDDFYRRSQRRWRDLARTARLAVVFAQFPASRLNRSPHEVRIEPGHPLVREWAIVFSAPGAGACLAGWEIPAVAPVRDAERRFEVLWSPEPEVVRAAVGIAAELLAAPAPELAADMSELTEAHTAVATTPELRSAVALTHRMVAYLAARRPDSRPDRATA